MGRGHVIDYLGRRQRSRDSGPREGRMRYSSLFLLSKFGGDCLEPPKASGGLAMVPVAGLD